MGATGGADVDPDVVGGSSAVGFWHCRGFRPYISELQDHNTEKVQIGVVATAASGVELPLKSSGSPRHPFQTFPISPILFCARKVVKFARFIGPGFLIAVAYIDPGNYATDVAAGASYKYSLLFVVLLSNLFAILLQSLCIKLGTVTGLNLAENCREHLPRWLVIILYIFAEAAIIATDIAEVGVFSQCYRVHNRYTHIAR